MKKKSVFIGAAVILVLFGITVFLLMSKKPVSTALKTPEALKEIKPSETSIDYTDPAGFSFSYPDNLSISNNASSETPDSDAYADLQIFSKDKSGSLTLRITDTKLKNTEEWLQEMNISDTNVPLGKKLGELQATEVKTTDRLLMASLDQGILFTVEMPLIEQEFWQPVYEKILTSFTFAQPEAAVAQGTSNSEAEVIFEGEEVIE